MSSTGSNQQTSPRLTAADVLDRSTTTVAVRGAPTGLSQRHPPPPPPRQIRFVATDGQPHLKRKRINAACRTCRKRKTRCSGERPVCATCRQNGHACLGYAEAGPNHPGPDPLEQTRESRVDDEDDQEGGSEREITPLRSGPSSPIERHDRRPETLLSGDALPDLTQRRSSFTTSQGLQRSARGVLPAGNDQDAAPDRGSAARDVSSPAPSGTNAPSRSSRGTGSRIPYFRYFGPTASVLSVQDVPVQTEDRRKSKGAPPSSAAKSSKSSKPKKSSQAGKRGSVSAGVATSSSPLNKPARSMDVQFYDPSEPRPTPFIVNQLVETFFVRLGCNFPFLQREPFQEHVTKKTVEILLVDAVCAVAARFSSHPLLIGRDNATLTTEEIDYPGLKSKSEYGQPFAKRAKSSLASSLSRPSLAAVQACLLLAYEEYGSNQESGVWIYLGIAIRMAQDLGMQKITEARSDGRGEPTPRTAKYAPSDSGQDARKVAREDPTKRASRQEQPETDDQEVVERQRTDTLWTLFFLDRVVSSGTGRPVTLRDKDVELSFPSQDETEPQSGWPAPFPSVLRIIHLYGRVTDLLSHPRVIKSTTQDTLKRLAGMEKDLTGIYQRLSPQLHFSPANFQHYAKNQQGTNFLSLHFWFHALIILIHQPTLLHPVDGRIQLLSNSREVCMTSAKTIADILAFAEMSDARCFIGNPFSGAPMYLAACAFLTECSLHLSCLSTPTGVPPLRQATPRSKPSKGSSSTDKQMSNIIPRQPSLKSMSPKTASNAPDLVGGMADQHRVSLTAAVQNYRRCYKALKTLEVYWAGTKATITELDQKARSIIDLDMYMAEVIESTGGLRPSSTRTPSQRTLDSARTEHGASRDALVQPPAVVARLGRTRDIMQTESEVQATPGAGATEAVGWTLNGTTDSPSSNLTLVYPASLTESSSIAPDVTSPDNRPRLDLVFQERFVGIDDMPQHVPVAGSPSMQMPSFGLDQFMAAGLSQEVRDQLGLARPAMSQPSMPSFPPMQTNQISASDAEVYFDPNSRYSSSPAGPLRTLSPVPGPNFQDLRAIPHVQESPSQRQTYDFPAALQQAALQQHPYAAPGGIGFPAGLANAGMSMFDASSNMMMESQDMEMSALSGEVPPWLGYLPQDYLALYNAGDQHGQPSHRQVQQSGDGAGGMAPEGPPGSQAE